MKILGYLLMALAVVLPAAGVWAFIANNRLSNPKDFAGLTMISLFIFVTMSTMGLIILASSKAIELEAGFLRWLAGATVAEVAGISAIIVKAYFSSSK
jgi:hypothetical protein